MSVKNARENENHSRSEAQGPSKRAASESWEEHAKRAQAAVAITTDLFLRANDSNIAKSTSAVAAKSSYVSGMFNTLSAARNALGFWGADQILRELERLNANCTRGGGSSREPETSLVGGRDRNDPESVERNPLPEDSGQKVAKGLRSDPMFA
jgi:hypothetical protein